MCHMSIFSAVNKLCYTVEVCMINMINAWGTAMTVLHYSSLHNQGNVTTMQVCSLLLKTVCVLVPVNVYMCVPTPPRPLVTMYTHM